MIDLVIAIAVFSVTMITVFILIDTFSTRKVHGGLIGDDELTVYFGKHLAEYNSIISDNILHSTKAALPFISTLRTSIFTKYYIQDHGQIPRWSAYHKVIAYKISELTPTKRTLVDI